MYIIQCTPNFEFTPVDFDLYISKKYQKPHLLSFRNYFASQKHLPQINCYIKKSEIIH